MKRFNRGDEMELIKAKDVATQDIHTFVDNNQTIDMEKLLDSGYIMKRDDCFEGCFVLEERDPQTLWLRQLFVMKKAVTTLPVLLETILALAKSEQAEQVVIYSHQDSLDMILEALQLYPQTDTSAVDNPVENIGKWWMYKVC